MMRTLVLGAAAWAITAGTSAAQAPYPAYSYGYYDYGYKATAPLYDYAGGASGRPPPQAAPHGYGPVIYTPQLYAPAPAFPTPPTEPGYYTARSVVVAQPFHDYAPGYWGR